MGGRRSTGEHGNKHSERYDGPLPPLHMLYIRPTTSNHGNWEAAKANRGVALQGEKGKRW